MTAKISSSTSSSQTDLQKSNRGSSSGHTYKKEEKELCCLEIFWEAVKNFFINLCCCCCKPTDVSDDVEESEDEKPASRHTSAHQSEENPSEEPATKSALSQSSGKTTNQNPSQQKQNTAISTSKSKKTETQPETKKSKKKASTETQIPLFTPLQTLAALRQQEVVYYAPLPKRESAPSNIPDNFPYLDQLKKTLGDPKLPLLRAALQNFRENAIKELAGYVKQLIEGWCPSLSAGKDPLNALQHPTQLELIFNFCKERLNKVNTLLEQAKQPKIEHADFFTQFELLKSVAELWQALLDIAQKPDLTEADCEILTRCSTNLPEPDSAFYKDYPVIQEHLKALTHSIFSKLVVSGNIETLREAAATMTRKLSQNPPPKPKEDTSEVSIEIEAQDADETETQKKEMTIDLKTADSLLSEHKKQFTTRLLNDIATLFQMQKESAEGNVEPLEMAHLTQIKRYVTEEVDKYNKAIADIRTQHPGLNIGMQEIDHKEIYKQAFGDLKPLARAWRRMKHMLSADTGIDAKIKDLKKIAHILPEKESSSWKKYPQLKEAMGKELLPLLFKDFASYQFDYTRNQFNQAKFEADKTRKAEIDAAFEKMAQKLGCEQAAFKLPEIVMAVEDDHLLQQQDAAQEIESRAAELYALYLDNLEHGEPFALTQVVERIKTDGQRAIAATILAVMADQVLARKIAARL